MQIGVSWVGHVIIDDNIDALNVYATSHQVSGHQNSLVSFLETFVSCQPEKRERKDKQESAFMPSLSMYLACNSFSVNPGKKN